MKTEKINVAEYNKQRKVLSQKYWYWYRQYFIAKVLLFVLTIVFTSIVNIADRHQLAKVLLSNCNTHSYIINIITHQLGYSTVIQSVVIYKLSVGVEASGTSPEIGALTLISR